MERYDEAIHIYFKAIELDPHDKEPILQSLVSSLHSVGRYEEAIKMFDEAI